MRRLMHQYARSVADMTGIALFVPGWMTGTTWATALGAAGCGEPIVLAEMHYTVTRREERQFARVTEPVGDAPLAYVHLGCWPERDVPVIITATTGSPEATTLGVRW